MTQAPPGLVLIDKPAGITSFRTLETLKHRLGTRKVGHTGTLDPFATGLLAALTGAFTRLCPLFMDLDKSYEAELTFGATTDTLDPDGEITAEGDPPGPEEIQKAIPRFVGRIEQVPPAFSAVNLEGRRAHQLARRGEQPRLSAREVTVHAIRLLGYDPPRLRLQVDCSKGTYIRSLARDLAEACGSCAFVSRLRRLRLGDFRVEEAVEPERFDPEAHVQPAARFVPRLGTAGVRVVGVRPGVAARIASGGPPSEELFTEGLSGEGVYAALDGERLLALLERRQGRLRYRAVFPRW